MSISIYVVLFYIVYVGNFQTSCIPMTLKDTLKQESKVQDEKETLNADSGSPSFNPELIGGHYQGDMILPKEILRGAASRPTWQRWPSGVVPFDMKPSISTNHTLLILEAMRIMENITRVNNTPCITFRPKTNDDKIFITIQNGSGCSAHVGYLQNFTLNRTVTLMHTPTATCMRSGIIQHELLHILGFFHEQSRPDRDEYVSIRWENIVNGTQFNFEKYSEESIDLLDTPYDYGSVMHYQANAFSSNGLLTIVPVKNASAQLGQRLGLSPIDILEVQRYYGCIISTAAPNSHFAQQITMIVFLFGFLSFKEYLLSFF